MTGIFNLLWVLIIEYAQNLPFIAGIVLGLIGIKRGLPGWRGFLIMMAGSFVCAAVIGLTDWIKIMATTKAADAITPLDMFYAGLLFSAVCGVLLFYFSATSGIRKPLLADILLGLALGALGGLAETYIVSVSNPLVVVLHMLGFAAAAGSLITLIRRSAQTQPGKAAWGRIALVTGIMTLWIAIFDYVPFLQM